MNRHNSSLNQLCHTCYRIDKGTCKGKQGATPCIIYKSKDDYAKESVKAIKELVNKQNKR